MFHLFYQQRTVGVVASSCSWRAGQRTIYSNSCRCRARAHCSIYSNSCSPETPRREVNGSLLHRSFEVGRHFEELLRGDEPLRLELQQLIDREPAGRERVGHWRRRRPLSPRSRGSPCLDDWRRNGFSIQGSCRSQTRYAEFRSFHPTFQQLQGPALEQHVNMLPNSCMKVDQLPIKIVALAGKSIFQYFYTS